MGVVESILSKYKEMRAIHSRLIEDIAEKEQEIAKRKREVNRLEEYIWIVETDCSGNSNELELQQ